MVRTFCIELTPHCLLSRCSTVDSMDNRCVLVHDDAWAAWVDFIGQDSVLMAIEHLIIMRHKHALWNKQINVVPIIINGVIAYFNCHCHIRMQCTPIQLLAPLYANIACGLSTDKQPLPLLCSSTHLPFPSRGALVWGKENRQLTK